MNKHFSVILGIFALIALTMTFMLQREEALALNQQFHIETIYGNKYLIDDVFEISNIRQEGSNQFSRVVLGTSEAEITPIRYDFRHHLDERQLAMREFYRRVPVWARDIQNSLETEHYRILRVDHWPNGETFNILNKETGNFVAVENTMNRAVFHHWVLLFFMEHDGGLYGILAGENEPKARFYQVDLTAGSLNYVFTVEKDSDIGGRWLINASGIYFYENGGWEPQRGGATGGFDPETGADTLTASLHNFYQVDMKSQAFQPHPAPTGVTSWGASPNVYWHEYIIRDSILTYNDNGEPGYFDGISIINLETGLRHVFQNTIWDDWAATQQVGSSFGGMWGTEFYVIGDFLISSTRLNESSQMIKIYDLNAMALLYQGRIHLRKDQGLLPHYWGGVRSFEVRLREEG